MNEKKLVNFIGFVKITNPRLCDNYVYVLTKQKYYLIAIVKIFTLKLVFYLLKFIIWL